MSILSRRTSSLTELVVVLILAIILSTNAADDMIPYFTVEPAPLIVSQKEAVNLSCHVHPSSAVVRWKVNNEFITVNNSYGIKLSGSELHMPTLSRNLPDMNLFQCTAETSRGTIVSKPAKVAKAVLRRFEERGDLHLNVTEGSNLVLPCQPPYSRPKARIMFRFNDTALIDKDTERYKILPSGNLQIIGVTSADQGQYRCVAENAQRNRTRTSNHVIHLHILNTKVPSQEPAVNMPSAKLHAIQGESVVLECSAVGNPQPIITWEKYGGKLLPGRYMQKHGNLFLANVTGEDEGTYLCKADNGLNSLMLDGLKAMQLDVAEPPQVETVREVTNVSLGGLIELQCLVAGKDKVNMIWRHNGNLLKSFTGSTRVVIRSARATDAGLYQCFIENDAGMDYATMLVMVDITRRDSGSLTLSDQNVTQTPPGGDSVLPAGQDKNKRRHWKKRRRKTKGKKRNRKPTKKNLQKSKLVPPNKPEVKQLSDTSVMLNWTVPDNEGLKITFFIVQYKRVGQKKSGSKHGEPKNSAWKTDDVEIDSHVRMYEVKGLKPRAKYKFRIAAVYSNNDNTHGPNSDRFEMKADPQPESKPPGSPPTIVQVIAIEHLNIYALNVKWQHNVMSSSPIEGFFIYYKPFHAQDLDFQNVTLLEPSVRVHLLTNLLTGTAYLIKMQAFNSAGRSPYSNQVVERTLGPDGPYDKVGTRPDGRPIIKGDKSNDQSTTTPESTYTDNEDDNKTSTSKAGTQSETLYMVLGIVLGVMMLLLIVFMFMCWWKQRQQRRMMDAMNDAVRNKFQDPSQRIYADSLRKKIMNGGMNGVNGTIANGHIPRNYHKMNINVNPLSEMDGFSSTEGSNQYTSSPCHPNGSVSGNCHRASDNNCNNINQSKSLENSLQQLNHHSNAPSEGETTVGGGGESLANPPSPMCNNVPVGHNSDVTALDRRSNRSCGHTSCDPCDSSLSFDDTGGVHSGRHRKRRRRAHVKEQTSTRDQGTNTDLSSNDGTMDLADLSKTMSSSQESGQMSDSVRTFPSVNSENNVPSVVPV